MLANTVVPPSESDPLLATSVAEAQRRPAPPPARRTLAALRIALATQTALSLIWLVLLLINLFTRVLFSTRSLLALAYVGLALTAAAHALLFFRTPTPVRLTGLLLVLLSLNVALAVWPKVRLQLQPHGLAALGWAWIGSVLVFLHAYSVRAEESILVEPADDVSALSSSGVLQWLSIATTSVITSLLSLAVLLLVVHLIFSV